MKRIPIPMWAVAALLLLGACGDPKVVVRARLDGRPVADLPVRLLSYDWASIRDSLGRASKVPEPTFPQELIQQVRALDAEAAAARLRGDTAMMRVAALRDSVRARVNAIRAARSAWANKAYTRLDSAIIKRTTSTGRFETADTTDASGRAELGADKGEFWVSALYTLPYSQLEWSVPVRVTDGQDSVVVELSRRNAKERPLL